jgi:hypothetical protein
MHILYYSSPTTIRCWGPQVVLKETAICVHSTLFSWRCIAASFELLSHFLLPRWSKSMTKKYLLSIILIIPYSTWSQCMRWFWAGGPRYKKGWETLTNNDSWEPYIRKPTIVLKDYKIIYNTEKSLFFHRLSDRDSIPSRGGGSFL